MAITEFQGKYRFLSNFWPSQIEYEGIIYPSVEHAYQAAKTLDMSARKLMAIFSPREAKKHGRKIALRGDWERVKLRVMLDLVRLKFAEPALRKLLLATGTEELIEGNWWHDTFWGVCNGKGENHLGKILMQVRSEVTL